MENPRLTLGPIYCVSFRSSSLLFFFFCDSALHDAYVILLVLFHHVSPKSIASTMFLIYFMHNFYPLLFCALLTLFFLK